MLKMKTEYITLDPYAFDSCQLQSAAKIVKNGGLVAFPTETVYGLGADAYSEDAAQKIYAAKGRPSNNPLIVHIARAEDAEKFVYTDENFYKVARAFMPGPITVVMKSKMTVSESVCAGLDTLALRVPVHPIARALIEVSGCPIAAPSANTSGRPSPTSAAHVMRDLDGKVDMIIDGGECEVGLESTIIKLTDGKAVLLRPGAVTYEMLCELLGEVEIAKGVLEQPEVNALVESPGMLISHYAPNAPFYLVKGKDEDVERFLCNKAKEDGSYVLAYEGECEECNRKISLGSKEKYKDGAKRLFSALREADDLGALQIYAQYPDTYGMGLALLNRMLRASSFRIIELK